MSLTHEQAAFKREVYQHWSANGITPEQIADQVGISPQRLRQFVDGSLSDLTDEERAALSPLEDEFVFAEDRDEEDYRSYPRGTPPRTARAIFREYQERMSQ